MQQHFGCRLLIVESNQAGCSITFFLRQFNHPLALRILIRQPSATRDPGVALCSLHKKTRTITVPALCEKRIRAILIKQRRNAD
jgi:hypothetical protein